MKNAYMDYFTPPQPIAPPPLVMTLEIARALLQAHDEGTGMSDELYKRAVKFYMNHCPTFYGMFKDGRSTLHGRVRVISDELIIFAYFYGRKFHESWLKPDEVMPYDAEEMKKREIAARRRALTFWGSGHPEDYGDK